MKTQMHAPTPPRAVAIPDPRILGQAATITTIKGPLPSSPRVPSQPKSSPRRMKISVPRGRMELKSSHFVAFPNETSCSVTFKNSSASDVSKLPLSLPPPYALTQAYMNHKKKKKTLVQTVYRMLTTPFFFLSGNTRPRKHPPWLPIQSLSILLQLIWRRCESVHSFSGHSFRLTLFASQSTNSASFSSSAIDLKKKEEKNQLETNMGSIHPSCNRI